MLISNLICIDNNHRSFIHNTLPAAYQMAVKRVWFSKAMLLCAEPQNGICGSAFDFNRALLFGVCSLKLAEDVWESGVGVYPVHVWSVSGSVGRPVCPVVFVTSNSVEELE